MAGLTNISIKNAEPGRLSDGRGLILDKSKTGSGRWMYRYQHLGKRRDMGLGSWPTITLAQARAARDKWAAVLADGPIRSASGRPRGTQRRPTGISTIRHLPKWSRWFSKRGKPACGATASGADGAARSTRT
nr:Arm DNA-binding domain-containing protein [Puniceibacterium sp. IMCC21224]